MHSTRDVRLLDQAELLPLALVQARLVDVPFLETLEGEDQQLRVVLVRERRKRDRRELARLEPVHRGGVDRHPLLRGDVRAVLQVVVLALLLRLEPQPREPPQVLLAHRLVHRRAAANPLSVVVRHVRPPIRLTFHVPVCVRNSGWDSGGWAQRSERASECEQQAAATVRRRQRKAGAERTEESCFRSGAASRAPSTECSPSSSATPRRDAGGSCATCSP